MDFKSLISKIESIDGKIVTPAAPQLPKAVQLNEDAELRVLAGTSSYITEAKKKAEEKIKETSKTAKKEKVEEGGLDMNLVKAAQGGMDKNPKDSESDKNVKKKYGYRMDGEPAERDDDPTKQEPVNGKILRWMDNYLEGSALPVSWKSETQNGETSELSIEMQIGQADPRGPAVRTQPDGGAQ